LLSDGVTSEGCSVAKERNVPSVTRIQRELAQFSIRMEIKDHKSYVAW
jgi:hypothetical protein